MTLAATAAMTVAATSDGAPKKIMCQEFTATWCTYCPDVAEGLAIVIENNAPAVVGLMIHGGDAYTTSLGNQLINFYSLSGYPTVWVDGTWSQVGSYGSASANATALQSLVNNASTTTDVTIDVVGESLSANQYRLDIELGVEAGGATRNLKLYITQVYDLEAWPESNEHQFNTLRQSAATQTVTLSSGQSQSYSHTFTLSGESLNTEYVNYIVWAQDNLSSGPAMIFQTVEHKHGAAPPANVTVGPGGDFATIQAALDEVGSGSTVTVAPGTYNVSWNFNGRTIDLMASAGDPTATILDAGGMARAITMLGGSSGNIDSFTVTGGYAQTGSAMMVNGSPTITNCIIRDNVSTQNYVVTSAGSPAFSNTVFCSNDPNNQFGGNWVDNGNNTFSPDCGDEPCDGDFNADGTVNVDDVLFVLSGFGSQYNVDDLLMVLGNFGDDC
jgi:hypothetical protein